MTKIPVVICIDVEPDERAIAPDVPKDWKGFEATYEFFRELRPRLEAATCSSVHFSWFFRMDPQITHTYGAPTWVVRRYGRLIEELASQGDELGLHTHAWRWDDASRNWIADFDNQDWIDRCVRTSFEAFQTSLDRSCLSFRFGDRWMNDRTLDLIEKLGARFDLTVEPGQKTLFIQEPFTGSAPDYTGVPRHPYRPSRTDFTRRSIWRQRNLWMIPLSTGDMDWALTPLKRHRSKMASSIRHLLASVTGERPDSATAKPPSAYEGCLDRIDSHVIAGWAYDSTKPDYPVFVEISDGEVLAAIPADTFRPDLLVAGKGHGKHAFNVSFPSWLKDGKPRVFHVRIAGSNYELENSPKEVRSDDSDPEFITLLLSSDTSTISRIVDRLLLAKSRYLALAVRSGTAIHRFEQLNLEHTFNYISSHQWVNRFVFETPAELIKRAG